jgi:hypothetical protein
MNKLPFGMFIFTQIFYAAFHFFISSSQISFFNFAISSCCFDL